ncbi:MAG TPA: exosortase/archaeosortase family protein [Bryobacteraceae bacterium]|nr:exosortase/archaeosortase family protein [Bryobacteraceae bacterium]
MANRRALIAGLSALALLVCYAPTLRGMFDQWSHDEDMSHGFAVPFVILWILWRERARWLTLAPSPSGWGFPLLLGAAAAQAISSLGLGLFAASVAFLVSAVGVVLCLGGFAFLRVWAFPFALSLFMLPKLAIVYNQTTLPLQLLASRLAASTLAHVGYRVVREGVILDVGGHRVSVVEACSGVRYLLSLAFIAVVFAYMADVKPMMRWLLLFASVPIAIVANAVRVAVSAAVPALDSGTPHEAAGAAVFVLCLILIFIVHRLFNSVYAWGHGRA